MRYTKSVVLSHSTSTQSSLLNRLRRWRGLGACTLLAFAFLSGSKTATAVVIDNFTDPSGAASYVIDFLDPDPFLLKQQPLNPLNTIGGERDLLVDVLGPVSLVSASGTVGAGSYQFGSAGDSPSMVTLQYDGVDADIPSPPASLVNAQGLDNVDLNPGNSLNAFSLTFNSVDTAAEPSISFRITVTGPGGSTEYFGSGANGIPDNAATWNVLFNQFSDPGFNWHDVTSVTVALNELGVKNVDFDLSLIQTRFVTPEASSFALLLCGGAASLLALRRRRAK